MELEMKNTVRLYSSRMVRYELMFAIKGLLKEALSPVRKAQYNSDAAPPGCLEGTRTVLLRDLVSWGTAPERVFWLLGLAGTGKSAIAREFCEILAEQGRLGGSFFISRDSADRRTARHVVLSLIYQLCRASPEFRVLVVAALRDAEDLPEHPLNEIVIRLIIEPLKKIHPSRPLIVVIDALDECDKEGVDLQPLLASVSNQKPLFPLKLFFTSRAENAIYNMVEGIRLKAPDLPILKLHDVETSIVTEDVRQYLTAALRVVAKRYNVLVKQGWPAQESTLR